MRITHICLLGPVTDGFSYQDNLLPKYHHLEGHEAIVICSQWIMKENNLILFTKTKYYNNDGVLIYRLPIRNNKPISHRLKRYVGLLSALEDSRPDIVFIHGLQTIDTLKIIRYLKANKNVTVYVDNHADWMNSAKNWFSLNVLHKGLWRYCAHKLEKYVKKFYGVLPARVDFLKEVYGLPEQKCELLVLGADDDEVLRVKSSSIRKKKRDAYGVHEGDILIVTGGKIDSNKPQVIDLMKAVNNLQMKRVKLAVFGSVNDGLSHLFKGELSENVFYTGWKNSSEIYDEFEAADLVAFPGLHSVLWEQAVGTGKPCIFRRMKGFEHVDVGGNCKFFNRDTIDEYCKVILESIMDLNQMKLNAEEKGMKYFSYRSIANASIEKY